MKITFTLFDPATGITATLDDEWPDDLGLGGLEYQYTEGNYACDCNRRLFLGRAGNPGYPANAGESECGNTIRLQRLVAHMSDGDEVIVPARPDANYHLYDI